MAATTKLIIFNAALRELGSQPLADLTSTNTRLHELSGAWDHAVEHALAMKDWAFARRRSALSGVSDTSSFPPYTYRYSRPSDYLRKCWLKTSASDEFQVDHAEVAAAFYAMQGSALLEYVSDHADNYDPANWPPHFTKVLTLYLASLVAPKLARAGAGDAGMLDGKIQSALADAEDQEVAFLTNAAIPSSRTPVLRRAMEFLGQQMAGSVALHSHADMLRWHMSKSWDHAVKYVLELGAWNFASRRAVLSGGGVLMPGRVYDGIIEGYSVGLGGVTYSDIIEGYSLSSVAAETAVTTPSLSEYAYGFTLPDDFVHKIWLKPDANAALECRHQFLGNAVYTNTEPVVMEYVSKDDDAVNPDNWSASFTEAVAAYLALLVTPELMLMATGKGGVKVNANELRGKLEAVWMHKLSDAKLRDAIQQYPMERPRGRFLSARMGG